MKKGKSRKETDGHPFAIDLEKDTIANGNFRDVVWTGTKLQLVLMSLNPDEVLEWERHYNNDQLIRVERGGIVVRVKNPDKRFLVYEGGAAIVPAGVWHEVRAMETGAKLYTIYAPRHHKVGTVNATAPPKPSDKGEPPGTPATPGTTDATSSSSSDDDDDY